MKKIVLLLFLLIGSFSFAQIVTIPDANFKAALIEEGIDTNGDGEIQVSEAEAIEILNVSFNDISSLEGIGSFINLTSLTASGNQLTSFDGSNNTGLEHLDLLVNDLVSVNLSNNTALRILWIEDNELTEIDLSNNIALEYLNLAINPFTSIDFSNNEALEIVNLGFSQLTTLDLSNNPNLTSLSMYGSTLTETINVKNGSDSFNNIQVGEMPNLIHICVNPEDQEMVQSAVDFADNENCVVNSFCTFVPGGDVYYIEGNVKVDIDQDGCDADDLGFPFMQLRVEDTEGNFGTYSTDNAGDYNIAVPEGAYTVTYEFPYSSYFDISPPTFSMDFPTDTSPFEQDICLTPNGTYDDLQVTIIPLDEARPGFDATYKIIYANVGTTIHSGNVQLNFDDDIIDLVSVSTNPDTQNTGELSWSFTNLAPLQYKTIDIVMNLNSPTETPPLNGDEILCYNVSISPVTNDEVPADNEFSLKQTVVNSYDPNDKTCLEGNVITPDLVGEYVHYLIRFENTGTASAINVVIRDVIDTSMFDMSSFVPLDASHDFVTSIQNENEVEFIFEGIELPFDDANNDGYVLFKIKTLPTLELGDTFENSAEIYFDFNFPIITNVEQTLIDVPASTDDFSLNANILLYPNPAVENLTIESQRSFDAVLIHDLTGREIHRVVATNPKVEQQVDVSNLKSGIYYLTITSGNSKTTQKFLKL